MHRLIGMARAFENLTQWRSFEHFDWSIACLPSFFKPLPTISPRLECDLILGLINALQEMKGPSLALTSLIDQPAS